MAFQKVLTHRMDTPDSHTLRVYEQLDGYQAARKALAMKPAEVTAEVKASGLRGRGGAGFPAGMKWGFIPAESPKPKYLVVNGDESEPGTFKDRLILEKDPHALVEGCIIASYAIGCHHTYIYCRGEFGPQIRSLQAAVDEAYAAGYLGANVMGSGYALDITVHRGAGAYICGEETALLNSLEGKRGYPRVKPPFPATHGAFGCPTCVNNVETIATVPWILLHGAAEYSAMGIFEPGPEGKPPKVDSRGTRLMCISGHVARPGVYEIEMGIPMKRFIEEYGGGVWKGRKLKAVIPGGSSCPILTAEEAETLLMSYESIAAAGSMAGSGGMMLIDDQQCMVALLTNLLHFYAHESCGQCTPCREGCDWLYGLVRRIEAGKGTEADLETILQIADSMEGKTICALAAAATMPTRSYIKKFRQEFVDHFTHKGCPKKAAPAMAGAH